MKSFTLLLICVAVLTAHVYPTHAQTSTASSTESGGIFDTVVESVSNITETVQEQLPLPKPEAKSVLSERAQERITNLAANISNRFDGIIARLQNIINRLNTRIEKLEATGADVSQAKQSLASAGVALEAARDDLDDIDDAVATVVGSPDPKTEWQGVRAKFISAREHVRTAHSELRATVAHLKNAQPAATAN